MDGIVEGLKVIDLGHMVAVPSAGAIMADWGADVLKVEPLTGDIQRGGIDVLPDHGGAELAWRYVLHNRNKKSLAVDLKTDAGKSIVYKLVEGADVVMSNYESGSLQRLGMDYATLSRVNPRLIYASLTAYGSAGPDREGRGVDFTAAWARAGIQHMVGDPGTPPAVSRPGLMDRVTGTHIVAGIMAALYHREKTGQGQQLELCLYHSAVWTIAPDIQGTLLGVPQEKHDRTRPRNPLVNVYRTKDGRWLQLGMLQPSVYWPLLCQAIERPDLQDDPRFSDVLALAEHRDELVPILDEEFAGKTLAEWEEVLVRHGCICGRVQTPEEVTSDPQAIANGFFGEIDHPEVGRIKLVSSPVKFHQNPASIRTTSPEVGQHTEEVLLNLGYIWDDIARLKDDGVIL